MKATFSGVAKSSYGPADWASAYNITSLAIPPPVNKTYEIVSVEYSNGTTTTTCSASAYSYHSPDSFDGRVCFGSDARPAVRFDMPTVNSTHTWGSIKATRFAQDLAKVPYDSGGHTQMDVDPRYEKPRLVEP